jgi:hypothetical protein
MNISFDLTEFSFYFTLVSTLPGQRETIVFENAKLLLNSRLEWIGIGIGDNTLNYLYWVNNPEVDTIRLQEVYLDYDNEKIVGIEVNLWIENRDIIFTKLIKATEKRCQPDSSAW